MNTSYKTLHIEMFTIYTVYLYNLSIWAIVMLLFLSTNMYLPTCHLVLANATIIFVANVSIDFRNDMPKVICYLDELLQVV